MAREKSVNPVQAAKKAEKQKQLKKQKAQLQASRNEKLARRNPARLQREIDDLKEREQNGELRPQDRSRLSQLEKDVNAIKKARDVLGDKAPVFKERKEHHDGGERRGGHHGRGGGILGKRRRDGQYSEPESSDTDPDVGDIPMPRDTPPPIPARRRRHNQDATGANDTPLGEARLPHALPPKPVPVTSYSAAPQLRNLRKEAARFVPAAVQNKMKLAKGQGRLLEPEELDKLEKEGYTAAEKASEAAEQEAKYSSMAQGAKSIEGELDDAQDDIERELRELEASMGKGAPSTIAERAAEAAAEEAQHEMMAAETEGGIGEAKAEDILRHVQMEEVEDEDL